VLSHVNDVMRHKLGLKGRRAPLSETSIEAPFRWPPISDSGSM
jgi:hypothetical protein